MAWSPTLNWKTVTIVFSIALAVTSILSGVHFGLLKREDRVNNPTLFANASLGVALTIVALLIPFIAVAANRILETPDNMNMLLFGQGLFMLLSGSILIFVILNIKYG